MRIRNRRTKGIDGLATAPAEPGTVSGNTATGPPSDSRPLRFFDDSIVGTPLRRMLIGLLVLVGLIPGQLVEAGPGRQATLAELSLEQLGNIEVTSVSKEPEELWRTPAAIYVITQEDIRRSGATSIPEILRLAPGVEVARVDSDHWSVAIRGFGGALASKLLVLIDGRSVYTPLYAGVYWQAQNVPLEDVERIEVIRGPGGTIWGANAVDGVINIITKSSQDTQGSMLSAGAGSVDEGTAGFRYGGGKGKGLSYRLYGMGFDRGPEFHADGNKFDEWRLGQAGFRTDWNGGPRDAVTFQGDVYNEEAGAITTFGVYSPPSESVVTGMSKLSGGNLLGRWKHTLDGGSDVQIQAYYDHNNHFEPEYGESRATFDVDFLHHLTLPGKQDFLWGLGARVSPGTFAELVPTINFLPVRQTDQIYSGFVQDAIPLLDDRLSLTVGSKLEHNNFTGFEVQPSARLLWNRTPHQAFWASVSRSVRTPSRLDEDIQLAQFAAAVPLPIYLRVLGDGRFFSEQLIAYEAGYRALPSANFYVDLALFHNDYNYLSSYQVGSFFLETSPPPAHAVLPVLIENGIKGTANGFEVAPDWKPAAWWQLKASYSYLNLDLQRRAGSNDPSSVLNNEGSSPRNQITVQSLLNLPRRFEFDQTYRQVSALPAQTSVSVLPVEVVKAYGTADARLGWRPTPHVELSITGDNLLEPHHAEFGGNPGPLVGIKRSVYGKAVFRW